jgi:sarcosine oxidase subunit gamma
MAESALRQSALAPLGLAARAVAEPGEAAVRLAERPFRGQLNLRLRVADADLASALEGALGFPLPTTPNTSAAGGGLTALWLGPDEWLVVTPEGREARVAAALGRALGSGPGAVTEVGDARTVIALAGARAREVLMKGCSLDFHPRVFAPGQCAQSVIARAQAIVHLVDETPLFELYVQRSFAHYLWAWLEDAAAEYGLAIVEG